MGKEFRVAALIAAGSFRCFVPSSSRRQTRDVNWQSSTPNPNECKEEEKCKIIKYILIQHRIV